MRIIKEFGATEAQKEQENKIQQKADDSLLQKQAERRRCFADFFYLRQYSKSRVEHILRKLRNNTRSY